MHESSLLKSTHINAHENKNSTKQKLAILGTMSDAGKSTLTAGICRVLVNGGMTVAPFKAQNMSNNAAPALLPDSDFVSTVTEGTSGPGHAVGSGYGEVGTAQALQAEACRQIPRVEMNPVLLKSGGRRENDGTYLCSVHVLGKQIAVEDYGSLGKRTHTFMDMVVSTVSKLQHITDADMVVLEGAGSCTEMNLMDRDIVNIPLVRKLNCPWLLVANIDPGGVFAQIVGTKACLSPNDWDLCVGVIVNKLRGEAKYFEPGPSMLAEMVGKPIFVVPFLNKINLPEEDGLGVERRLSKEYQYDLKPPMIEVESNPPSIDTKNKEFQSQQPVVNNHNSNKPIVVVVIAYPHIAISDDLTPLEADPRFEVQWRRDTYPPTYPETTCLILPGSRLSLSDLHWIKNTTSWGNYIQNHVKLGGHVLGLCGGYQILGNVLDDSLGVEGTKERMEGLGLLPVHTWIAPVVCKVVKPQTASLLLHGLPENTAGENQDFSKDGMEKDTPVVGSIPVKGFELHCGRTQIQTNFFKGKRVLPLLRYNLLQNTSDEKDIPATKEEGILCGNVKGTYLHGILKSAAARRILICGELGVSDENEHKLDSAIDPLDRLANHLEECGLDFDTITRLANLG